MYSEQAVIPGAPAVAARPVDPNDLAGLLAGVPGGAELAKVILQPPTAKFIHAPPGSGIVDPTTGQVVGTVPALPKDNRMSVKTEVRPDGTYALTTDTLTGETTVTKLPGIPGQPQFAPQQPQQPTAAQSFTTAMQNYQAARDAYGEEDPRTKNLGAIAAGLRRVDPESGTPITAPKTVDPLKQAIADMMTNKKPPGPGITPPAPPRPAPRPAATPAPPPRPAALPGPFVS